MSTPTPYEAARADRAARAAAREARFGVTGDLNACEHHDESGECDEECLQHLARMVCSSLPDDRVYADHLGNEWSYDRDGVHGRQEDDEEDAFPYALDTVARRIYRKDLP